MPASKKKTSSTGLRWDSDLGLLAWLASCVSVFSFLFFYQRGDVLLYGDAVAHINIARHVFDSKTPGLLQLGTVWLPLPHLLMIPFLISDDLWQRGAGGSIPSMAAYIFGVIGIFRLVRGALSSGDQSGSAARIAAWIAAIAYAANPNLVYMQATAMGEAIYLAFFIWSVVYFNEFVSGNSKALVKCGVCLAAACLTRYDGWFVAMAMMTVAIAAYFFGNDVPDKPSVDFRELRFAILKFLMIAAAAPSLWLAYNAVIYRNPLEFENGRYSAKSIEQQTQNAGNPGHPGSGNLLVAGLYFVKAAELNMAHNQWLQRLWVLLALAALVGAEIVSGSKVPNKPRAPLLTLLFLLLPVPFYALSVAYGGVPIFVPTWWPFSYYNLRYGLQLLPALAIALGVIVYLALRWLASNSWLQFAAVLAAVALIAASYASFWHVGPISLVEAQVNMRTKNHFEQSLADWLKHLPPDSTLLMYLGDHVGALEQADIPLRRVINEGNHRVWKQPTDPEGLWERALANPSGYADYVIAFEGDPVWQAANQQHLRELIEIHVTGQSRAVIYRAR